MINIIHGDCLEKLKIIKDVTLIFCDSPYNIGINYGSTTNDNLSSFEYRVWCEKWLRLCYKSLLSNGSLWHLNTHENTYLLYQSIRDCGFHIRQTIIWYETFGVNCTKKFNRCSRTLLHCIKNKKDFIFNEKSPYIRRKSDRQELYNDKRANPDGKLYDDVWIIPRIAGTHTERIIGLPTQIPLELLRRVIACASHKDDLVVDPFSGSGTTALVCLELERNCIGIEINEQYIELSKRRLGVA